MSSFLADLPDSLPLSAVVLPGTHDTMAFYGYPVSQCQSPSCTLSTQLLMGVRVIDIRLSIIRSQLIAYHGIYPQRTPFSTILTSVNAFLTSPQGCRETIVMSIKQEDFAVNSYLAFSRLVKECMMANPGGWQEPVDGSGSKGMWFLENRVPKLGEVRGKVVLFSRFGGNGEGWERALEGMGIHPLVWPDSSKEGFEWMCKGTLVKTHDWYNIPSFLSIPEKVALSTRILIPKVHPDDSNLSRRTPHYSSVYTAPIPYQPPLAISFFSAASFPLSLPPVIARGFGWPKIGLGIEGVNSRVGRWLLGILGGDAPVDLKVKQRRELDHEKDDRMISLEAPEPRIRGWVLLDYFDEPSGLVPLLVECNFRGRRPGDEGWPR
ncbi:1-phosphatidylinositol phosphodiesterase [Leucoagaricus sp. SymC.cos]|nr:1-phosphatidylinositol phosphodiesterase [Leucoagaricus sp. SymC.cos]